MSEPAVRRIGTFAAALLVLAAACVPSRPTAPIDLPPSRTGSSGLGEPLPRAMPMSREEALSAARRLVSRWQKARETANVPVSTSIASFPMREDPLALLTILADPCLEGGDFHAQPCEEIGDPESNLGALFYPLLELARETAPLESGSTDTLKLLFRLENTAAWYAARHAIERILERRFLRAHKSCERPDANDVATASADLDDFFVLSETGTVRRLTKPERADLAYLYAAVRDSGPAFGSDAWVPSSPLPAGHPDLQLRAKLNAEMDTAHRAGDIGQYAKTARDYLASLGYPGPLRTEEDGAAHWKGPGYLEVLREYARAREMLGETAEAERAYRHTRHVNGTHDQIVKGAIRTAEVRAGCEGSVAERLFAINQPEDFYGINRLIEDGYDVPRLYRGALLTSGRADPAEVRRALQASPLRREGIARLERLGSEWWAGRTRAIPGLADTARAKSVDALARVAAKGDRYDQLEALLTLGRLLRDDGADPCKKVNVPRIYLIGGLRAVQPMVECGSKIDPTLVTALVRSLAPLQNSPDDEVLHDFVGLLGLLGSVEAKPLLQSVIATSGARANGEIEERARSELSRIDMAEINRRARP
ncbi:MAG: hypothetical protein HOW73_03445 [Polyangiaceae bacterium]|nr:hypothetical protein [Polyangiaceae bacterium]